MIQDIKDARIKDFMKGVKQLSEDTGVSVLNLKICLAGVGLNVTSEVQVEEQIPDFSKLV